MFAVPMIIVDSIISTCIITNLVETKAPVLSLSKMISFSPLVSDPLLMDSLILIFMLGAVRFHLLAVSNKTSNPLLPIGTDESGNMSI